LQSKLASFSFLANSLLSTISGGVPQKGATIKVDRPKLDAKKVWASFAAGHFELDTLNGLEFRTLCSSEEPALRSEFIRTLERNPDKLKRALCLYGLVNNYFALWREMPEPDSVERLLRTAFERYGGKNPVVRRWSSNKLLLSAQAATARAEEICVEQNGVDEELKTYCVGPATKLGLKTRASAAKTAGERFRQVETSQNEEWSQRYLQWVTEKVLSDLTLPDAFCPCICQLILSESAKRSDVFRRALRVYIQHHKRLGDPRLRESSPNWRSMVPEAGQRYLSWLARDSILLASRQVPLERIGYYVRRPASSEIFLLDFQMYSLIEAMDAFNALSPEAKTPQESWLTFAKVKECATEVGATLDSTLSKNDVVVPSSLGLDMKEDEDGALSFLPKCAELAGAEFHQVFERNPGAEKRYSLDRPGLGRVRIVLTDQQHEVLRRMKRVRRIQGSPPSSSSGGSGT
jgi:hypothetical protein